MKHYLVNIIFVLVLSKNVFSQMGPVHLDFLDAGNCEPDNYVKMDLTSLDETRRGFSINVSVPFDLDPMVSYQIVVDKIGDGEVQEGVFRKVGPYFCEDIEKFIGKLWKDLAKAMGMNDGCPKKKGDYSVQNFPVNYDDIKLDQFLYGRFIANVIFSRMGQDIACIYVELTNTPPGESV